MKSIHFAKIIGCSTMVAATSLQLSALNPVSKPNIVIIITDQQSADAMSNRIGSRYLKTSNMDYLADHGISFTRAFCANPLCIPSRASIFTGQYPHKIGVQSNDNEIILDPVEYPSMGTIFQKAGYETAYFGKWHLPYDLKNKQSHGFEYMAHVKAGGMDSIIPKDAIQFILQKHEKPFLLVASFLNPHNICEWARGEELPDGAIETPPVAELCPPLLPNHAPSKNESDIVALLRKSAQANPKFPVGNFDDAKWRQYRWAYYRMIEKMDAEIGEILDVLRNSEVDKNTVIVFLSNHGDSQGAHLLNQKTKFFEESINVPFIISSIGINKPEISTKLIQTGIDLIPTICDYAGIPVPSGLVGQSARNMGNNRNDYLSRKFIVSSVKPVQGSPINGIKPEPDGRMVRGERYKYWIYNQGTQRETLFDLKNDPGEMINLAADPNFKTVIREYRKYLGNWCKQHNDPFFQYYIK